MNANNQIELDRYIKSITHLKRISITREKELAKIIATSLNEKAKNKAVEELVEANLFLVVDIALKRIQFNERADIMEIICVGNRALVKAANEYAYNHKSHAHFGTFAYITIFNDVIGMINNRLIYLPKDYDNYERIVKDFEVLNNIKASIEDVAKLLNVSPKRASEIRKALNIKVCSIEELLGADKTDSSTWEDVYGTKDLSIDKSILRADLLKFINKLKPKQKRIIKMLYLDEGLNYVEASKIIGCSKQYVETLCKRALRDIRAKIVWEWGREHGIRPKVMNGKKYNSVKMKSIKMKNKEILLDVENAEKERNRRVYKEVMAHYLGEIK